MKVYKHNDTVEIKACCDKAKETFDHISTDVYEDYITYTDWGIMYRCEIEFKYCPFCGEKIEFI